jgi:hypothetical protein
LNPIVVFIVCLFAASAMTDDRIASTERALAQKCSATRLAPIGLEVVLS